MQIDLSVTEGERGAKLGIFLRRRGISLSLLRSLKFEEQGLALNGARARTNALVEAGDTVSLLLPDAVAHSARAERLPVAVLYENADAMVVDKPAGQVVHPSASHHGGTLANAWCGLMETRGLYGAFRPVGRLDGDTSGLVLCAMHAAAAPALAGQMKKAYLALAGGSMPAGGGVVSLPLGPAEGSAVRQQVDEAAGKASETAYEVLAAGAEASLVAVWPQTGRTHQIRVHMAALGHPLLGDALYGGDLRLMNRHALHCAALRFPSPLFEAPGGPACWAEVTSPLPEDMARVAGTLFKEPVLAAAAERLLEWR